MCPAGQHSEHDPFAVLGLAPGADVEAVRGARRRLAMELHPDRGGDADRMRALNEAYDEAMARLRTPSSASSGTTEAAAPASPTAPRRPATTDGTPAGAGRGRHSGQRTVERDEPSFVIEALPFEAFEALLIVATWMGEVLVDDPPYLLEAHLLEPAECWCRLELLPEAGATTVMLTVAGVEGIAPPIEAVRDEWVSNLNLLGRAED